MHEGPGERPRCQLVILTRRGARYFADVHSSHTQAQLGQPEACVHLACRNMSAQGAKNPTAQRRDVVDNL